MFHFLKNKNIKKVKEKIRNSKELKTLRSIKEKLKDDKDFSFKIHPARINLKNEKVIVRFRVEIIKKGIKRAELVFNSNTSFFGSADFVKEALIEELNFQDYVKAIFGTNNFRMIKRKCKQC